MKETILGLLGFLGMFFGVMGLQFLSMFIELLL